MDARDQLRRYLEQRREMGERELVLDTMSVDDAMALLAGKGKKSTATSATNVSDAARPEERATAREVPAREQTRDHARDERREAQPVDIGGDGDWRAALRATGAGPGLSPNPPAPSSSAASKPPADIPVVVPSSSDSLDAIVKEIASCNKCPLYKTATNPVPGEGSPHAQLMCVGEAPGATEDETGRPFIGAAGQLLTKILAAIDLPREQVYICNVLKHRPPGNRNPAPEEVTACSPYLIRQIELIRPKVILALGTFAAQTLLDTKTPIGKLRGQVHRYYGVPLVVTYHPAALLRNPAWKRPTWEDVQLARRILDSPSAGA